MSNVQSVQIQNFTIGSGGPLVIIAGMCVIESEALLMETGAALVRACEHAGLPLILKASFDKANRSTLTAFRGPGLVEGLGVLKRVKAALKVPVTTDVHHPEQADAVAEVVDLLQIPAFLCRQTDLLVACAQTGLAVNVKKGQFMAPWDMGHVVDKLRSSGCQQVLLTDRGTSFGYNRLVSDIPGLAQMRDLGAPVCFDATHSVQLPGAAKTGTGGNSAAAPALARAAVAAGVDAVFLECHPQPTLARSDAATAMSLEQLPALLAQLAAIDALVRER
jgi:2-dehydro-3-deoxyphosphooctonate aldolase (KDO 8-P synthase)